MIQQLKYLFHIFECIFSEIWFLFPSRKIKVIGITGTDGKTTTTHLLYAILNHCGKKVSMISSIEANINGNKCDTGFHTTTPRPFYVRKMMKMAVDGGSEYFLLEVTSHAMTQGRVWGIPFLASVITNITHDHLYFHQTFESYFKAKMSLLLLAKNCFINKDCDAFNKIKKYLHSHNKPFQTFTTKTKNADYTWDSSLKFHVPGAFNKENIMAGYSVSQFLGLPDTEVKQAISAFHLPKGRYDVLSKNPYVIIIDFAHTPHSLEQLLKSVKEIYNPDNTSKIVHVFGSASERDDSKRPFMGTSSSKYCDCIILTEEDYRKEDFNDISEQISKGIDASFTKYDKTNFIKYKNKKSYTIIQDRSDAINAGLSLLSPHDILVLTGKSHEKSLNRNGIEVQWDEYETVKNSAKKILHITI